MYSGSWVALREEFLRWRAQGLRARVWVRDDDACEVTPQLERLAGLAGRGALEIGLAVIPSRVTQGLVRFLDGGGARFVAMCHGWSHANYGSSEKPGEFGAERPLDVMKADAVRACRAFGVHFSGQPAIFVPPFGCIAPEVEAVLGEVGFAGLSNGPSLTLARLARLHAKFPALPPNPLRALGTGRLDVHVDPIDWRRKTAHAREHIEHELLGELRLRRKGYLPWRTPIGLLTHHLVHDEAIWSTCEDLLDVLKGEPAAEFPALRELIAEATGGVAGQNRVADPAAISVDKV